MGGEGLEPSRYRYQRCLRPHCLPIPTSAQKIFLFFSLYNYYITNFAKNQIFVWADFKFPPTIFLISIRRAAIFVYEQILHCRHKFPYFPLAVYMKGALKID